MNLDSLESILKKCFGCKKPFLQERKLEYVESDGEEHYRYLTASGNKAYDKLTELIYGLETIGVIENANDIIEELDSIVSDECRGY